MTTGESIVDVGRGIALCYDAVGDTERPPILLLPGLGQQLHSWPSEFAAALAARGFRVVRVENRDVGRSTHMDYPAPGPVAMLRGGGHPRQYRLGDMARDTVGLLDVLGLRDAHLVGISMGGMIAQTVAADHPGRVRTLTSIMSNTGAPRIGRPAASTWWRMATARRPRNREEAIEGAVKIFRHVRSHGYPFDEAWVREKVGIAWDRDPTSDGLGRQMAAVFASGDRTAELASIEVPTLVIHGDRDRMIHPSGGAATARAIPGAKLVTLPGMGHDLPFGVWDHVVELIADHASATTVPHQQAP